MNAPTDLMQLVAAQKTRLPALYGRFDFSKMPERFTVDLDVRPMMRASQLPLRPALLANAPLVDKLRAYTMLGDPVADAYAALLPKLGLRRLIMLLTQACAQGVECVEGAPPELVAFIREMEHVPSWVDMDLVEEGARQSRNITAHLSPYVIRGAFISTFLNKYAALPMALTGTLSNDTAARRVFETASFFTTTVMPGALKRHGEGFKAAAMVRLMHAMVRFNALTGPVPWDEAVYGVPIPQVDQMPAGLITPLLIAEQVLREGRTEYTRSERAQVELSRYRCYLLGVPEDLLPATPQGMVDVMYTRQATLRSGFEDATCGALLRATMVAYLGHGHGWRARLGNAMERGFAKMYFVKFFLGGDKALADRIGVRLNLWDRLAAVVVALRVAVLMKLYQVADHVPGLRTLADRSLLRKIERLLQRYGHAHYTTDASNYRPAVQVKPAP